MQFYDRSDVFGEGRSSGCSAQGVMMDYMTAVMAATQILVSSE